MPYVFPARHAGFTAAGVPVFAELPPWFCALSSAPNPWGNRHVAFTALGVPRVAGVLSCCAMVNKCFVEVGANTCFPHGPGGPGFGVGLFVQLLFTEVVNCASATKQVALLRYCGPTAGGEGDCAYDACPETPLCGMPDPAQGRWLGTVTLRGGTLNLQLTYVCTDNGIDPPFTTWTLCWSGCDEGGTTQIAQCEDPVNVDFGNVSLPGCCACDPSAITAEVNVVLWTNCYDVSDGRHVGFTADGKPVVALRNCTQDGPAGGCMPCCPLVATYFDSTGDCDCLEGAYALDCTASGHWEGTPTFGCPGGVKQHSLDCTDNFDGTVTLVLTLVCGVDAGGTSDPVTVAYADLEDLDVTFVVTVTNPASSCTGDCVWQWNEMAGVWESRAGTCSASCDECPNAPADPPPSPTDGQLHSEPCTGGAAPECCSGTVKVRVMR